MDNTKPYIIDLKKFSDKGGNLSFIDEQIPFEVKRLFWIYDVDNKITRGDHAHKNSAKCLICVKGKVAIKLTNQKGEEYKFLLDTPSKVLYFPKMHWIELTFEEGSILMALASSKFEDDMFLTEKNNFINTSS